jgi:hypothetical protein
MTLQSRAQTQSSWRIGWAVCLLGALAGAPVWAQPPACRADVRPERALFSGQANAVKGGTSAATTPTARVERLYEVKLVPQPQVQYLTPPGKVMLADGAFGGLVKFRVPRSGDYRVSLDAPFWIDVVADGKLLGTEDFFGQRGCDKPIKIVVFHMPADQELWLQISGARRADAQFTVTRAPSASAGQGPAH